MAEKTVIKRIEIFLESMLFSSRWLLAPFYFGLALALFVLLIKFLMELLHLAQTAFVSTESDVILGLLTLVDLTLTGSLLIIVIFSGYENFVSRMDHSTHGDRPEWMGHVTFSDLKIKLIGSIVAISGIELLKAFVNIDNYSDKQIAWKIGLHLTFVLSGVLFAVMDRLTAGKSGGH